MSHGLGNRLPSGDELQYASPMAPDSYEIVGPGEGLSRVELWSSRRLPFEPKGWLKQVRSELRDAIRTLPVQPHEVLQATYTSSEDAFVDVENVLFYNVGTGCFAEASRSGLRFERVFAQPPAPPRQLNGTNLHHHRYEPGTPGQGFRHWVRRNTLASWAMPSIPLRPQPSAALVWLAMKDSGRITTDRKRGSADCFGMTVRVHAPRSQALNLTAVVKPLLDGIIAGLHSHDGSLIDGVATRLATKLATDPKTIKRALMDTRNDVLGKRRLVHTWRDSVQWNPADDQLVAAEVLIDTVADGRHWVVSGELYEVEGRSS